MLFASAAVGNQLHQTGYLTFLFLFKQKEQLQGVIKSGLGAWAITLINITILLLCAPGIKVSDADIGSPIRAESAGTTDSRTDPP